MHPCLDYSSPPRGDELSVAVSLLVNRMKFSAAFLLAVSVALPTRVRAQVEDQFSWGLMAGAAIPARELAKDHNTGFNGGITFALGGIGQLVGFRIDGLYSTFSAKSGTTAGNANIAGGTANLVIPLLGNGHHLYLTGGVGGYGFHSGVKGVKSVSDWGLNGGAGWWLPVANAFIEARYHHFYRAFPDKHPAVFVPITLGVLF